MTRADGAKFGKTAQGAVWLAADRTSPYQFFQYWMQIADADVDNNYWPRRPLERTFRLHKDELPKNPMQQVKEAEGGLDG